MEGSWTHLSLSFLIIVLFFFTRIIDCAGSLLLSGTGSFSLALKVLVLFAAELGVKVEQVGGSHDGYVQLLWLA